MKIRPLKHFLPITALICLWFFLVIQVIAETEVSRNTLEEKHSSQNFVLHRFNPLLKGEKLVGSFIARHNNLGQIAIRFINSHRKPTDEIIFRLKAEDSNDWHYQAKYNTDQFQSHELFPFGFPIIEHSKDQKYLFEIESVNGSSQSGQVAISNINPPFTSRYTFSPKTTPEFISFIFKKIINILLSNNLIPKAFIYAIPLIFYLTLANVKKSYLLILLPPIAIIVDLITTQKNNNIVFWIVLLSAIISNYHVRIEPQIISRIGLGGLAFVPFMLLLGMPLLAEKLSIWVLVILVIYFIQVVFYHFGREDSYLNFKELLKKVKDSQIVIIKPKYVVINLGSHQIKMVSIEFTEAYFRDLLVYLVDISMLVSIVVSVNYIRLSVKSLLSIIKVYEDFFPQNHLEMFYQQTGQKALIFLIIWLVVLIALKVLVRNQKLFKFVLIPILLFTLFRGTGYIYGTTSTFQYEVKIWDVTPKRATLWDEVKIKGRNFREMPFKGKVLIDGVEHMILSWKDKEIVFQADPTKTKTGSIKIIDYYGRESENTIYFEYYKLETGELIK